MSVLPVGFGSSGGIDTGDIGHSLRFRSAASAYLSKTITTDATSTYFAAVKRGKLGVISPIFDTNIKFNANDTLTAFGLTTTAVFRDPTSWLFIHVSNGGLYINGVSYGAVTTSALTNPRIGYDGTNYFDGYIARCGCVAGSSSSYTNFGQLNTSINEWVTKPQAEVKAVVDAGGTNSFMLDFDDASTSWSLGKDFRNATVLSGITCTTTNASNSVTAITGATQPQVGQQLQCANFSGGIAYVAVVGGSSGAWTATMDRNANASGTGVSCVFSGNGWSTNALFSLSGVTYDHMLDVPGNSYATLNPIYPSAASITNGNLTSGTTAVRATMNALALDSKWEVTAGGSAVTAGVISGTGTTNTTSVTANKTFAFRLTTAGALDYRNVTDAGSWTSITTGLTGEQYPYGITQAANWNFGQAPLHASATYQASAGGYFYDTTAGYKALCQANLPDIDPTALLNPEDHHIDITVTKSGDTNFTLPWDADTYDTFFEIKRRDAAGDWYQIDGLRGYTKILKSNSTAAETTDANVLGVSGTTCTLKSTLADGTYIVSATKAGLSASRQTNTDGSITSTVSRNTASGFAIVSCTGTAANATVGHGLGVALNQIVAKALGSATEWPVYHSKLANTEYLALNTTAAKATGATYWNSTSPTSTVFSLGSSTNTNNTGGMIFYCYADSAIQKSFSYTGNGAADGPYVNLGFKCGRVLLKNTSGTNQWEVWDTAREPYNPMQTILIPNTSAGDATSYHVDMTAFAYKPRNGAGYGFNDSANIYIGHAWAATTGKYSSGR